MAMGKQHALYDGSTLWNQSLQLHRRDDREGTASLAVGKSGDVTIHIDYRQSGVGSNSCGEEQLEEYKVKRQDFVMSFTLLTVQAGEEINAACKKYHDD